MANHSGISTDILLFSDIHLSLTHHYRVHKHGLPHIAFRKDYLARLRDSVTRAAGQSRCDTISPVASSPVSSHYARSAEQESETYRLTRRGRCRMRPVRILQESVGDLEVVTAQDASDLQGALVYDCRPPLLPVSLHLEDIGALSLRRTVASASLAAPPQEDFMEIGGVSPEGVAVPELGVIPLMNTDTDLDTQVVSHPQWCGRFTPNFFSDQLFYCSNIIIIISGNVTKIVYICIIYIISAQKLKYSKYSIYIYK